MIFCKRYKNFAFITAATCLWVLSVGSANAYTSIEGPIIAKQGQVITGKKISSAKGPCIIIPNNVTNVRIQNNDIGPCGTDVDGVGVRIDSGARHIFIAGNTIHDVSTGVYADHANNPIVVTKNTVYDVRGPLPMGQMVKFDSLSGWFKSQIFGNISDKNLSKNPTAYEDHISVINSYGSKDNPIYIACNKLRGGDYHTGSGISIGEGGGEWFTVHSNIIVLTSSTGIRVAGGQRIRIFNNKIWNKGSNKESKTSQAFSIFSHGRERPMHLDIYKNQAIAASWVGDDNGAISEGLDDDGTARFATYTANNWKYSLLKESIWDIPLTDCQ